MSAAPASNVPAKKSFAQVAAAANVSIPQKSKSQEAPLKTSGSVQETSQSLNTAASQNASQPLPTADEVVNSPAPRGQTADGTGDVQQLSRLLHSTTIGEGSPQQSLDGIPRKENSDTKSVASRTTLTLDEKESLRPDDSASMQAAVEEDAFSPSGSAVGNSKPGSDPDNRAFRDQLQEIEGAASRKITIQKPLAIDNSIPPDHRNGGIIYPTALLQNNFTPLQPPSVDVHPEASTQETAPAPDEKLIEALASPKDRLFVLKIEQDMIDFVKDSKEDTLQLPQTHSFYRMLAHKLADYYLLGHILDDSGTSVVIHRTPNCRLPPPLIGPSSAVEGSTPPPPAPARKIMRRNKDDIKAVHQENTSDKNVDSLTSSKAPSDIGDGSGGDESKETPAKGVDKSALTREERENRYNEARARIFKDFEAPDPAEGVNNQEDRGLSRSSSTSGVKKSKKGRKQKDDGFEARSAFDQYGQRISSAVQPGPETSAYEFYSSYGPPGRLVAGVPDFHPNQTAQAAPYPGPNGYAHTPLPPGSGPLLPHGYAGHHSMTNTNAFSQNNFGATNGAYDGSQFSPAHMTSQVTPKGNAPSLAAFNQGYMPQNDNMGWAQGHYPNPYANTSFLYNGMNGSFPGYQGGQMMYSSPQAPYNSFPSQESTYLMQPPSYANFQYQSFNPNIQAFIPGTYGGSPQQFSPGAGAAVMQNNPMGYPIGSPMQRQSSSSSHASGFSASHMNHAGSNNARVNGSSNTHRQPYAPSNQRAQPPAAQSSISKWSTSANLPAKPPPPAIVSPHLHLPRDPDHQQPLPPKPFTGIPQPQFQGPGNFRNPNVR